MKKYLKHLLVATLAVTGSSLFLLCRNSNVEANALSYDSLQSISNKEVIEFEGGDTLPSGTTVTYTGNAKSYLNDTSYKNAREYIARFYTGNYSCSPINEVSQEVYLDGEVKTKTINTTGGYVLGFDSGATVKVSYNSESERYADLYIRVSSNDANSGTPKTNTMFLKKMMSISLNDEALTINDNAKVYGRAYKTRLDDDFNKKVEYAYQKDADGNWIKKTTELNMYGRYVYQDWQTVLVGKVLVKEGTNNFVYTPKNSNTSGQLDCMILDFDKYASKDVYEFENATLTGDAKTIANYTGGSQDLIRDFVTYNEDYSCSNYDFVKYAKTGSTLTMSVNKNASFANPHLILRVSSLNVNQSSYIASSVKISDHLGISVNGTSLSYPNDLYIEGRDDSANHDPDGISHGILGSLNSLTADNSTYAVRYMYLIWRTVDLGPISLKDGENEIVFSIITKDSNEYIGFDYFAIADVDDSSSDASSFANTFLGRLGNVCKPDGTSNLDNLKKIWGDMSTSYASLSDGSKTLFVNGVANSASVDPIERYLERYEYIGGKYQNSLVSSGDWNFIGRNVTVTPSSLNNFALNSDNTLTIAIVVISVLVSITGIVVVRKLKVKEN